MPAIVSEIVEVCVFRFRETRPEYLLLKRSPDDSLYPGLWQIVTGTLQRKERAVDAALREFREETGLTPLRFWTVPYTDVFYDRQTDAMNLSPVFAIQVAPDAVPGLSVEHSEFIWQPVAQAQRRLVWPGQRNGLEIVDRCIAGGESAMVLSEIPLPLP